MNTSHNYADFVGLSLESSDDFEPYGYDMEAIQAIEVAHTAATDRSIESVMFARGLDAYYYE